MRRLLSILASLILPAASLAATTNDFIELKPWTIDFHNQPTWNIVTKKGLNNVVQPFYIRNGTNLVNVNGLTAVFKMGPRRQSNMASVYGTCTNSTATITLNSSFLAIPVKDWYSSLTLYSGTNKVYGADGSITIYDSPELDSGNLAMTSVVDWANKTYRNQSSGPYVFSGFSTSTGDFGRVIVYPPTVGSVEWNNILNVPHFADASTTTVATIRSGLLTNESDAVALARIAATSNALGTAAFLSAETWLTAESDPAWGAVSNAVTTNAANGQTAYGWGNHASAGYLTFESDPVYEADWPYIADHLGYADAAYGWGNHTTNSYLQATPGWHTNADGCGFEFRRSGSEWFRVWFDAEDFGMMLDAPAGTAGVYCPNLPVVALSFVGNASGLTNIPAAQIVGTVASATTAAGGWPTTWPGSAVTSAVANATSAASAGNATNLNGQAASYYLDLAHGTNPPAAWTNRNTDSWAVPVAVPWSSTITLSRAYSDQWSVICSGATTVTMSPTDFPTNGAAWTTAYLWNGTNVTWDTNYFAFSTAYSGAAGTGTVVNLLKPMWSQKFSGRQ